MLLVNPVALRTSKTLCSFEHSECNRVNELLYMYFHMYCMQNAAVFWLKKGGVFAMQSAPYIFSQKTLTYLILCEVENDLMHSKLTTSLS